MPGTSSPARKGVLVQTKRHSFICSLLGIRHVVVAVNKIDLVDYRKEVLDRIVGDYVAFASALSFTSIVRSRSPRAMATTSATGPATLTGITVPA
jgi:sulfate adenylyltransferase subunit 1 (EFTu-like GTPase family)